MRLPRHTRWLVVAALAVATVTSVWLARTSPGAAGSSVASPADRDAVFVQLHERNQLRERMRLALNEAVGRADRAWPRLEPPPRSLVTPDLSESVLDLRRALDGPGLTRPAPPTRFRLPGVLDAPVIDGSLLAPRRGWPLLPEPEARSLLSDTIAPPRPTPPDPLTLVDH